MTLSIGNCAAAYHTVIPQTCLKVHCALAAYPIARSPEEGSACVAPLQYGVLRDGTLDSKKEDQGTGIRAGKEAAVTKERFQKEAGRGG